jgi:signal transduction histidine kinase
MPTRLPDPAPPICEGAPHPVDSSEWKKLEDERARLAQAQEAVRVRDEFLSIAAHELRTPLTALQLQLDGLEQSLRAVDPEVREKYARVQTKLEKAVRNTARLTDLVNTLLDLSRVIGGQLQLELQETDLAPLLRQVADDFGESASPLVIQAPTELRTVCDPFRFEQILTNLLSNAAKYGQGAPIEVELSQHGDSVVLSVCDHGIGIPAADHERIFQKFERAAAARNYGGMGLGLYITRHLIEAHGGSIRLTSTAGGGATFVARLPLAPPAVAP